MQSLPRLAIFRNSDVVVVRLAVTPLQVYVNFPKIEGILYKDIIGDVT